jgi:hypothetical protein
VGCIVCETAGVFLHGCPDLDAAGGPVFGVAVLRDPGALGGGAAERCIWHADAGIVAVVCSSGGELYDRCQRIVCDSSMPVHVRARAERKQRRRGSVVDGVCGGGQRGRRNGSPDRLAGRPGHGAIDGLAAAATAARADAGSGALVPEPV